MFVCGRWESPKSQAIMIVRCTSGVASNTLRLTSAESKKIEIQEFIINNLVEMGTEGTISKYEADFIFGDDIKHVLLIIDDQMSNGNEESSELFGVQNGVCRSTHVYQKQLKIENSDKVNLPGIFYSGLKQLIR